MTQKEFIKAVAEKAEFTQKDVKVVIDATFDTIAEAMANDDPVAISKFGKFTTVERAERAGHNPMTGEELIIPACKAPKFKASSALKAIVNE